MKRYYVVSLYQAFILSLMSAIFAACAVLSASAFTYWIALPVVHIDAEGKCVKITSTRNGEAYQCQDRDVILREYRINKPEGK